jgi:hypothetical protein
MSNGTRSTQRDEEYPTDFTHMIPADALHKIRSVTIHYDPNFYIVGFSFFDKDGALLWNIGNNGSRMEKEKVIFDNPKNWGKDKFK